MRSTNCRKLRFGSAADMTTFARSSSPFSSATPAARPLLHDDLLHGRARCGSPRRARAPNCAIAARHAAGAVLGEAPGAERAVDLAHVVVQQHVGRARRMRAQERADDAARRLGAFERIELEPLVEQIGRRLRDELGDLVELFLAQALRVLAELEQAQQVARADIDDGSGGTRLSTGLIALAARAITRPYSSEASASRGEWR